MKKQEYPECFWFDVYFSSHYDVRAVVIKGYYTDEEAKSKIFDVIPEYCHDLICEIKKIDGPYIEGKLL